MPVIVGPTRRHILRLAGAMAAGAVAGTAAGRSSRWALLSDTHLSAERDAEYRGFRPFDNLQGAVPRIVDAKPDGCVISGDLARLQGTPGDYALLGKMLQPITSGIPTGLCLGNHDDRGNFLNAFPSSTGEKQPVKGKHVLVIERAPVRLLLLDSLIVVNETPGYLGKAQRTWLDQYLQQADNTPTLIFVHHTLDDEDSSLLDSDRLLRLAAKHAKVKAIFYGHSHRYAYDVHEGVHLVNVPALGYNFNDKQPVGWLDAIFTDKGAELTLRAVGGNTAEDGKSRSIVWRS